MLYLLCKALHLIGMVAWFAGMFYIWRLFVYHVETEADDHRTRATLEKMADKLFRIIIRPASVFTLVFGLCTLYLAWDRLSQSAWIFVKLGLVFVLFAFQDLAHKYQKRLAAGERFPSRRFRFLNEVPTLLLIAIILLAVFKPF